MLVKLVLLLWKVALAESYILLIYQKLLSNPIQELNATRLNKINIIKMQIMLPKLW